MTHPPRTTTDVLMKDLQKLASRGWVSLSQFAGIAEVSYPTAMKMREKGEIRAVRVGGIWRIYMDEVRRFLREGNAPNSEDSQ